MANDLTIIENQLVQYEPKWTDLVRSQGIEPHQITQTLLVSIERNPKLLQCDRTSLLQAATSAACLPLVVDGITGQAFPVPFAGKVQLIIGYKGYNTMGGRSGFAIDGAEVREGDEFDCDLGSKPFLHHKPVFGHRSDRPITMTYATALRPGWSPLISVLDIDDVIAIKAKSPGARKSDSPWNDNKIGFVAMAVKSAKRRLNRAIPLNIGHPGFHYAAAMEETYEERGLHSYIHPEKGVVVDGEVPPLTDTIAPQPDGPPVSADSPYIFRYPMTSNKSDRRFNSIEMWTAFWTDNMGTIPKVAAVDSLVASNAEIFENLRASFPEEVDKVMSALARRKTDLLADS